tara:strand:- start:147 stop:623 length:477 start_codon:yes stop_codon:yes gene_type:complete
MDKKEEIEEEIVDLKSAADNLAVDPVVSLSDLMSDRTPIVTPNFYSSLGPSLEEETLSYQPDTQAASALDSSAISSNQAYQEIKTDMMGGQPLSEYNESTPVKDSDLFDVDSLAFPTEVDTEELPTEPGGTTPLASNGVANSRGSTDLRTRGNPYGYA